MHRHVGRHRHARAFVGVGRPGVERHDRGLQEEGQDHQHHGGAGEVVGRAERARKGFDRHRPAGAVEQRCAHQEHRRRGAAEHQVLQCGLGALRPPVGQQHQRVDRYRHQFQAEEQRQHAVGRLHQAHAVQRRQQQHGELAALELVARHQQHRQRQREYHGLGQQRGRVDRELAGERRGGIAAERQVGRGQRGCCDADQRDGQRRALPAAGDLQDHQQHDARQQQVLGQHGHQHVAADHGVLPGRRGVLTSC